MNKNLTIAILDDHPLIRDGLKDLVMLHPADIVLDAIVFDTFTAFWSYAQNNHIDLLFLDLELNGESGLDIYNKTIAKDSSIAFRTIIFSSHVQPRVIKSLYAKNIFAYLSKNENNTILWEAITEYAKGNAQYYSAKIQKVLLESTLGMKKNKTFIPVLTKREKEILRLIMDEKSSSEIAEILFLSEHTVESHRANLFNKVQVKNVAGLVKKSIEFELLDGE